MNDYIEKNGEKLEQRLLSRRDIKHDTECWNYAGAQSGNGYGHLHVGGRGEYAHRLSAVLYLGFDLGSGLFVLHACDNPACFNPKHLFIGTAKDNMSDAAAKGRMTGKKLQADQVANIKYRLTQGDTQRKLAVQYGVSTTAIGQIDRGQTWKDVLPTVHGDRS